jgi:hypothetical protein
MPFSLDVTDRCAGYLIARLAFEARYSSARQYFFRIEITVTGSGYGVRVWLALQATIMLSVRGTADVMASMISAPSIPSSKRGLETSTRPWSASVGDRLPRAADVHRSTSVSQQSLDEEDANVDRKSKAFVETAKSQSGEMSTIKDSKMKISYLLVALLLVSSLATSTTARTRINNIAARARSNVIEGRQIAAPLWSAA